MNSRVRATGGRPRSYHKARVRARAALLGAAALLLCAGPAHAQNGGDAAGIRLRPGDAVRLAVRDEPGLAGEFAVDDAGDVLLPMLGLVRVGGRPFAEVRGEVRTRFGRELARGEIQLVPLLRIAVLGEVRQPSLYPVDPTFTLTDLIALAGGLGPSADPRRVSLVRDGQTVALDLRGGAAVTGTRLQSGDQVVVGRRSWLRENLPVVITTGSSITIAVLTALLLR